VFFQYDHADGDQLICNAAVGKSCWGVAAAGDSLYVYGDLNNPHVLYKSKRGRPESFPVIASDGTSSQVIVGSPGNPIMAATDFGGEIVTLNLDSIYAIKVWGGVLQEPVKMPAQRGLFSKHAWCKGDNAIFYLAYDGVYAWQGGESIKLSQDIDWMFKSRTINGIPPVDLTTKRNDIAMCFHKGYLYLTCWDTDGSLIRLRMDVKRGSWVREIYTSASANYMLSEIDTGRLITCRFSSGGGLVSEEDMDGTSGTSDDWTGTTGLNGFSIPFYLRTGFFTPGGPSIPKLIGDVQLELSNPASDVTVKMFYDHSATADATDTFTIAAAAGRRLYPLPLQQSGGYTSGKEARSVSVEISGNGGLPPGRSEFYSIVFNVIPRAQVQFGRTSEWDEVGHPHDKRLYEFVVEYDTAGGSIDLALDTISGIAGATITLAVQTFTITGAGRAQATLKANDGIIAKKFRVRPTVETAHFKIFSVNYICENYPPDIVPFTPYDDYKHPYEKHLQVLHLDIDTGNVAASVDIEGDGAVLQTVSVTSTEATRHQQFALTNSLIAKKIRLKATAGSGGKFQLHGHRFEFEPYPPDTVYFTETSEHGYPYTKYLQQLIIDVNTNNQIVPVTIEGDGSDLQTVNIQTTRDDRRRLLTLNQSLTARKIRLKVGTIPSGGRFQLFSHDFVHLPADKGPVKHTFDWDDLGHRWDKHLQSVTFFYEKGAEACTMVMDVLTGIEGGSISSAAYTFVLSATAGRAQQTFPLPNNVVVKAVRLRPQSVPSVSFRHWEYAFAKTDYPQDIVYFTEISDYGYPHLKYLQQLVIDADTNGQVVPVTIEGDGSDLQTVNVTTTAQNRRALITLNQSLTAKKVRLKVGTIPSGGKFQLFDHDIVWQPADKGPVKHTFDWDDLGYPYDKRLTTIVLEYDKGAAAATMVMDTITGLTGATINLAVQSFVLSGTGRSLQQFAIADGTIVKMIRIRPVSVPDVNFKHWDYKFPDMEKLPADSSLFTKWDDLGWACRKTFRHIALEMDTGGVAATVAAQIDGTTVQSFSVTSTDIDRIRILTFDANYSGKLFRLLNTPGSGGKAQLYDFKPDFVREPCEVTRWDSLEVGFGYSGFRLLKRVWLQYTCAGTITFTIYRDGDTQFYQTTLAAQSVRDVRPFYLPAAVGAALNKSKRHRFVLTSASPFQFWAEASRVEWLPLGYDQRAAFAQMTFHHMVQPQAFAEQP
jgi:hypothetical protein